VGDAATNGSQMGDAATNGSQMGDTPTNGSQEGDVATNGMAPRISSQARQILARNKTIFINLVCFCDVLLLNFVLIFKNFHQEEIC